MPTDPLQLALAAFEICLLLAGAGLVFQIGFNPQKRHRWVNTNRLPFWSVTFAEFLAYCLLMFMGGTFSQLILQTLLGSTINAAVDHAGLAVLVYGSGFHGGALLGWWIFPKLRQSWYSNYGAAIPTPDASTVARLSWRQSFISAGGTLLVILPVLSLLSLGWTFFLRQLGLPDEPQDLLAIFSETRSPLVIVGMLTVACVIAPISEELIFRAGIYRFCRQRLGRHWGLVISGCLFGAMHANLAGFLPLAVLGGILALTYEATGSLRVVVIAHALFNLNTIVVILSGLPQTP